MAFQGRRKPSGCSPRSRKNPIVGGKDCVGKSRYHVPLVRLRRAESLGHYPFRNSSDNRSAPDWVPEDVKKTSRQLTEEEAISQLPAIETVLTAKSVT